MAKVKNPLIALSVLFFLTRLINLTIIPIFVDEAIYTRWSQVISRDLNQWAIPLSDGKQPLFMWIGALFQKLSIDPLWGERLVSVLAGFATLLLIYKLSKELFNKNIALIAALLFILCPFSMFYDRLAVADGLLTSFFILIALTALVFIRHPNFKNGLILGLSLGGGLLTKSTAGLVIFTLPFFLLFFNWNRDKRTQRLLELALFGVIAGGLGVLLYYALKLSPLFYLIGQRTPDFIFTPKEVLKHPLDPFQFRIPEVAGWLRDYLTGPILLLVVLGIAISLKKSFKKGVLLSALFLIPLLIEMEIAKGFTPRYFIFVTPFSLILAAIAADFLAKRMIRFRALLLVLLIPVIIFDFQLLTKPESAPIPQKEKQGYLEDWSAGYGIKEISQYLLTESRKNTPITVGTEGTQGYGTLPDGLQIYLRDAENIHVVGMGQRAEIYTVPKDLISDSKIHPAYLVVNENRFYDKKNPHLKFIKGYPKGNGQDPLLFYQIVP